MTIAYIYRISSSGYELQLFCIPETSQQKTKQTLRMSLTIDSIDQVTIESAPANLQVALEVW